MALIIEDGTGKPDANSWVSEPDATAYWTPRQVQKWIEADVPKAEAALINAADYLMMAYRWIGQPATIGQRLPWPRAGVPSGNGLFPADAIPSQVVDAQLLLAVEALDRNLLQKAVVDRQVIEETKAAKGLSKTIRYQPAPVDDVSQLTRFPMIDELLDGIAMQGGTGGFGTAKLVKIL